MPTRFLLSAIFAAVIATCAVPAFSEEIQQVTWQSDLTGAWKSAQETHRPVLLFMTYDGCFYCTKMKRETYADQKVAANVQATFIPVAVDGIRRASLAEKLHVRAYPTTIILSPEAKVLDHIEGYVPAAELSRRLAMASQRMKDAEAKTQK